MTDLEQAIQAVIARCRRADPAHMKAPISGETALRWLGEALRERREADVRLTALQDIG